MTHPRSLCDPTTLLPKIWGCDPQCPRIDAPGCAGVESRDKIFIFSFYSSGQNNYKMKWLVIIGPRADTTVPRGDCQEGPTYITANQVKEKHSIYSVLLLLQLLYLCLKTGHMLAYDLYLSLQPLLGLDVFLCSYFLIAEEHVTLQSDEMEPL